MARRTLIGVAVVAVAGVAAAGVYFGLAPEDRLPLPPREESPAEPDTAADEAAKPSTTAGAGDASGQPADVDGSADASGKSASRPEQAHEDTAEAAPETQRDDDSPSAADVARTDSARAAAGSEADEAPTDEAAADREPGEAGEASEDAGTTRAGDGNAESDSARPGDEAQAPPVRPAFDIVRVEPGGEAVIAGRAAPHSEVTVLEDGEPVATAKANRRGEFVALPDRPLAGGQRHLTLRSRTAEGEEQTSSEAVVLAVPRPRAKPEAAARTTGEESDTAASGTATAEKAGTQADAAGSSDARGDVAADSGGQGETADDAAEPLAVLVPREGGGEVRVLQQPQPQSTSVQQAKLRLETVQYTIDGGIIVRGRAMAGKTVVLYLNDRAVGRTRAGGEGDWRIVPRLDIPPGLHTLRVRQLGPEGEVLAEVETPFSSQPLVGTLGREDLVVVQPGGNLWTIAKHTYGRGRQYRVIYQANSDQIEDPDLIYPGQVFVLPDARDGDE